MDSLPINKIITFFSWLLKTTVTSIKNYKIEEKAVEEAAEQILNHLNSEQVAPFVLWLDELKIKTWSSFQFNNLEEAVEKIVSELNGELLYLSVNSEKRKAISNIFVASLYKCAKQIKPEEYVAKVVDDISKKQDSIYHEIFRESESFDTYFTLNEEWSKKTRNPKIDVDFFALDEEEDKKQIEDELKKGNSFYVSYYCKEEAILRIVSFLKTVTSKKTYVINNSRTWKWFCESDVADSIFICNFASEKTVDDVPNNICVYLVGDGERGQSDRKTISLKRRTRRKFKELLGKYGSDTEKQVKLSTRTNGLFYPFKAAIWNGNVSMYDEYENYKETIKLLLCFPFFVENDYGFLESFVDKGTFENEIEELSRGENPAVIKPSSGYHRVIHVADRFALWAKYQKLLKKDGADLFNKMECLLRNDVSSHIKKGYLESLATYVCYYNDSAQPVLDRQIYNILNKLIQKEGSADVGLSLYSFIESSPQSVLRFIKDNKERFSRLFEGEANNNSSPITYSDISIALQELAAYPDYAVDAYDLSAYFASKEKLNNSNLHPKATDVISTLFIPWFNYSGLSLNQRIEAGKKLYKKYGSSIEDHILQGLAATNGPTLAINDNIRLPNDDFTVTYNDYFSLKRTLLDELIEKMTIKKLSEALSYFDYLQPTSEQIENVYGRFKNEIDDLSDDDKFYAIERIREFVHDCRYFKREYFLDKDDCLQRFANIVENISYKNGSYKYLSIFYHGDDSYPLLNPKPFTDKGSRENDDLTIKNKANEALNHLMGDSFDFEGFIRLLNKINGCQNVCSVFLLFESRNEYKKRIVTVLCKLASELGNSLLAQAAHCYVITRDLFTGDRILNALHESENPEYQSCILAHKKLSSQLIDIVCSLSEETKKAFWSSHIDLTVGDLDTFEKAESNVNEYGSAENWVRIIFENVDLIGNNKAISLISNNIEFVKKANGMLSDYYLEEMLERCSKENGKSEIDILKQASFVEIELQEYLRNNFVCLNKLCSLDSGVFSDLLIKVHGNDPDKESFGKNYILLRHKLFFCPGYINKAINESVFDNWIQSFINETEGKVKRPYVDDSLGRLFAFCADLDGEHPLPEHVCHYIENNYSDSLKQGLYFGLTSPKGVFSHWVTDGSNLRSLGEQYRRSSEVLKEQGYEKCSQVFSDVAQELFCQADQEREDAVNGEW